MSYSIIVEAPAERELRRLRNPIHQRISRAIDDLADNPRPAGCRKMQGQDAWRIRVGDYRIIYEIHDDKVLVIVIRIGHRSDVYR